MDDILLIGCGKTAKVIALNLAEQGNVGTFYLKSKTVDSAKNLEKLLNEQGKPEVEILDNLPKKFPRYAIIAASSMPPDELLKIIQTMKTTNDSRVVELGYNIPLIRGFVPVLKKQKDTIFILVTNPVDYLTNCLVAGGVKNVYGFGMDSDTERFRRFLSMPNLYCVGIHGEAIPVANWQDSTKYDSSTLSMDQALVDGARTRGIPYDKIGETFARFFSRLTSDEEGVVSICTPLKDYHSISGVCMSVPVRVRNGNILGFLELGLNKIEIEKLKKLEEQMNAFNAGYSSL